VPVDQRRLNGDGQWVDAEPTRHVVRAFKTMADNIAESLQKGDRVFVHGTVTTDSETGTSAPRSGCWPISSGRACVGHPHHQATRTRAGDEAHYEAGGAARDDALAQEA